MIFTMGTYSALYDTGFDFSTGVKCNYKEFAQKYRTGFDFSHVVILQDTIVKIAKAVETAYAVVRINSNTSNRTPIVHRLSESLRAIPQADMQLLFAAANGQVSADIWEMTREDFGRIDDVIGRATLQANRGVDLASLKLQQALNDLGAL